MTRVVAAVAVVLVIALSLVVSGAIEHHYTEGNGVACAGWGTSLDTWWCWDI